MGNFSEIFGNAENIAMFSSLINSGKLSHAYLLSGPEGSGKKTMALSVAAELASSVSDAQTIKRIKNGYCPDVSIIRGEEDKKSTGVETVREFISKVALSPEELEFKMFIFDKADKLTPQAQNSLLKVIEEPPADVYIFLLCEEPSSMLGTVRSRVQNVAMQKFTPEQIKSYFKSTTDIDTTTERFEFASRVCLGAIGKVDDLIKNDAKFDLYNNAFKIVEEQAKKNYGGSFFDFSTLVISSCDSREKMSDSLDFLLTAYRDLIAVKVDPDAQMSLFSREDAERLSEKFAMASLECCSDAVSKIKRGSVFNTNLNISSAHLSCLLWNAV